MNFLVSPMYIYIYSLVGYSLWGHKEWDTPERLTFSLSAIPHLCTFVYCIPLILNYFTWKIGIVIILYL